MQRRLDLYSLRELQTPCVGESHRSYIDWLYNHGGGALAPKQASEYSSKSLSEILPLPMTGKQFDVNLVEIMEAALEEHNLSTQWRNQFRGTCVGQGAATGCDMVMAVRWLVDFYRVPGRAAVATAYAGSRVEIAGKPGRWDGSNGEWVAAFLSHYGVAVLSELGLESDELVEDERLALSWCASRHGVPEKFEKIAMERPIMSAPLVVTAEELIACLNAGNPVLDASNLIPANRNTDSVVPLTGRGGHLTVFGGIRWVNGEPEILYVNSWGRNWGRNGCVWITMRDALRILAQRDSYGLIGVQGLDPSLPLR